MKPLNDNAVPEALAVSKLDMKKLAEAGGGAARGDVKVQELGAGKRRRG